MENRAQLPKAKSLRLHLISSEDGPRSVLIAMAGYLGLVFLPVRNFGILQQFWTAVR